jgi:hypothetical protein
MLTKDTILKQGDKEYPAVEVEGVVYWVGDANSIIPGSIMMLKEQHDQGQFRTCYYIVDNTHYQQLMIDPYDDAEGWGFCKKEEVFNVIAQSKPILEGVPLINTEVTLETVISFAQKHFKSLKANYPKGGIVKNTQSIFDVLDVGVLCGFKFGKRSAQSDKKWTDGDFKVFVDTFMKFWQDDAINLTFDIGYEECCQMIYEKTMQRLQPTIKVIEVDDQFRTLKITT